MSDQNVTQEQIGRLIEDASYLQKEAEALQYVIDEVPYNETPPDGQSIATILSLINHAQRSYFQPVFDDAVNNRRPTRLANFEHYEKTFQAENEELENIQKLLHSLAKHRASLINRFNNISLTDWGTIIYDDDKEILLFKFIRRLVQLDQIQLKRITNLVMVYNQEQATRREINSRNRGENPQRDNR